MGKGRFGVSDGGNGRGGVDRGMLIPGGEHLSVGLHGGGTWRWCMGKWGRRRLALLQWEGDGGGGSGLGVNSEQ